LFAGEKMAKILVVDDNEDILYTVKLILESKDSSFKVDTAKNGIECLKYLGSKKPDLILMDIMMPELDGMDTAIKIRENPELKEIPIIFLSAKTDKLSKGMGSICGNDYIEKPFINEDLYNRVKKMVESKNNS
jgi:CheY-like chemotaxis protein